MAQLDKMVQNMELGPIYPPANNNSSDISDRVNKYINNLKNIEKSKNLRSFTLSDTYVRTSHQPNDFPEPLSIKFLQNCTFSPTQHDNLSIEELQYLNNMKNSAYQILNEFDRILDDPFNTDKIISLLTKRRDTPGYVINKSLFDNMVKILDQHSSSLIERMTKVQHQFTSLFNVISDHLIDDQKYTSRKMDIPTLQALSNLINNNWLSLIHQYTKDIQSIFSRFQNAIATISPNRSQIQQDINSYIQIANIHDNFIGSLFMIKINYRQNYGTDLVHNLLNLFAILYYDQNRNPSATL